MASSLQANLKTLFSAPKRGPSHALPITKPSKKVKPSQEQLNDPLYQILSWRDDIQSPPIPPSHACRHISTHDITTSDPEQWGSNIQGIFLNIDWERTPMEKLTQLVLSPGLLSNGMAFIWGTKNNIGQLMDYMELMGYVYAQNFTFVLLSRNKIPKKAQKSLKGNKTLDSFFKLAPPKQTAPEQISKPLVKNEVDYEVGKVQDPSTIFLNSPSEYFCESQKVLYMFRKVNKKQSLQLRHQRTSDVYFTIGEDNRIDWKAKEIVYRMIETLLINANYKENQSLKLMELWSEKGYTRKGWVTVSEDVEQVVKQ